MLWASSLVRQPGLFMKIVARGCKYVRGKEGEQFFRRRIEAIRRGRIVKHDEAKDGLTTSQQIAHE